MHHTSLRPRRIVPLAVFAVAGSLASVNGAAADVIFVNAGQALPQFLQTGATWATAYKSLQDALADALAGDEIWVAAGTYKPTTGADRSATFTLKSAVKLYGGFQVGDLGLAEQDPDANATILSGEIGGAGAADNSLHVVTASGVASTTLLDGFRIVRGNADNANGAGATITGSSMTVRNCTFAEHLGGSGGALFCSSAARIVDCTFQSNTSTGGGGALRCTGGARIYGCRFLDNHAIGAGATGGAVFFFQAGSPVVANCVFAANSAPTAGGAIGSNETSTTIAHCTFVGNSSAAGGAIALGAVASGSMTVGNSIFFDNSGGAAPDIKPGGVAPAVQHCLIGGAFAGNVGCFLADPEFEDADGADDLLGTADDDFRLHRRSPAIDAGAFDLVPDDLADLDGDGLLAEKLPQDISGSPRLVNDTRRNTGAGVVPHADLGAHELLREEIVWCVDADAAPGGFGGSWDDPLDTIQEAFDRITDIKFGEPAEIWIADGLYKPTTTNDRTKSFDVPEGARVLGGFAGFEGSRSQRSLSGPPSILSGAIGGPASADNSFHVVTFTDSGIDLDDTVLDGFTIVEGRATGSGTSQFGGGIFIANSAAPRIRNCRILGNAANKGGGIATSGSAGGIVFGCLLAGNSALVGDGGGGYFENSGAPSLLNCTIVGNVSLGGSGGGLFWNSASSTVGSSILYFNSAAVGEGQREQMNVAGSSFASVSHSCVQCFEGLFSAGGNFGADPRFVAPGGDDGLMGTLDDTAALQANSSCIDVANFASVQPDKDDLDDDGVTNGEKVPVDLLGNPRQRDDLGVPNGQGGVLAYDVGAVEFQGTSGPVGAPADLDHDGDVDGADLGLLLAAFGTSGPTGDLNNDCTVDGADLGLLLSEWS